MPQFSFSYFGGNPSTFDNAPIPFAVTDTAGGTIAYINETFCAILGRAKQDLTGVSWISITHPADVAEASRTMRSFMDGDESNAKLEKRYMRPDGSSIWVGLTLFRSPDEGKRDYHFVIATNLTASKKSQELLATRTRDLDKTREAVINSMAILSEFRDRETGEHIIRTRLYVQLLLDRIPYPLPFSRKAISLIANSAVLHDIGKVGIPDHILLKPGRLTAEEFEIMKTHTTLGAHAIMKTQRTLEKDTFLMFAKDIAEFHHERWDGKGYPFGLAGDHIPVTARVMALADVYDALRSERPYKQAYSHETALEILRDGSGTQFDPLLTGVFLANQAEIARIASTKKDELERELQEDAEAYA